MSGVSERMAHDRVRKPARSKTGCLTCLQRKVRCNEQRPRCNHCERLNLQCAWRTGTQMAVQQSRVVEAQSPSQMSAESGALEVHSSASAVNTGSELLDSFDFNNSIWHDTSMLDATAFEWPFTGTLDLTSGVTGGDTSGRSNLAMTGAGPTRTRLDRSYSGVSEHHQANGFSPASSVDASGYALVEHFLASVVPPILSSVEVGPRWTSTKMLLASLAGSSPMVKCAMMAFSALELSGLEESSRSEHKTLYDKASRLYSTHVAKARDDAASYAEGLPSALATAFFLAYSDLVTNRVRDAQGVLKDAANLLGSYRNRDFSMVERRLIAWIRLVDGRASSAGADSVFLAETDKITFSPATQHKSSPNHNASSSGTDSAIEDILFDVIYAPGLSFYQQVQSVMARVSNIDPWHRARGTVSAETEVMAIAADIASDLRLLEARRPALMDHAVAGGLTERHIAYDIATAITRSYRVYWANYQAGYIHLHRVAYKHLPPTDEVVEARATIKRIAHFLEQTGEHLPVNFIWPLLMACCEEDDLAERVWMIQSIRNMQSQASNAKPIADVLEEVHRRQDASKQRADVRQASMDLFNMSFAVV